MKSLLNIFLLICLSASGFAQLTADLNWGNTMRLNSRSESITVVGIRGERVYALGSSSISPTTSLEVDLLVYDVNSLQLIKEFELINNRSDQNFESLIINDEQILVFTSFYDRKLGFKILMVSEFDEVNWKLGDGIRVDEVFSSDKEEPRSFRISSSPDKKGLLIFHENTAVSGNKSFNMKVLRHDFNTMWEKEIELNYKDKMVTFEDLLISDDLTVYLQATMNPYGLKKSSGFGYQLNLKNSLFIYRPYEDRLKEYEFALSRNWIGGVKIKMDAQQNVLASAYFTLPNDFKVRGFVIFKIDGMTAQTKMRKMVTLTKEQFEYIDDAVGKLKDYSRMEIGSYGAYNGMSSHMNTTSTEFELKTIFTEGGDIALALEALRRDERCTESLNDQQMLVTCEKHYFYGDILLFFFNEEGVLNSIKTVDKIQHALENKNPYYSFSGVEDGGHVYLFYNDDVRNKSADADHTGSEEKVALVRMTKAQLAVAGFSMGGNRLNLNLAEQGADDVLYFPGDSQILGASSLLLFSQKEKNYKFGKLLIR